MGNRVGLQASCHWRHVCHVALAYSGHPNRCADVRPFLGCIYEGLSGQAGTSKLLSRRMRKLLGAVLSTHKSALARSTKIYRFSLVRTAEPGPVPSRRDAKNPQQNHERLNQLLSAIRGEKALDN
jgi:hypothetical protein